MKQSGRGFLKHQSRIRMRGLLVLYSLKDSSMGVLQSTHNAAVPCLSDPSCCLSIGSRVYTQTFPQSTTRYEIKGLQPSTDYIITLYTLYDGREEPTPGQRNK